MTIFGLLEKIFGKLSEIACYLTDSASPAVGLTDGAPVDAPVGNDPVILIDPATQITYYWDAGTSTWIVGSSGGDNFANADLTFDANHTHDGNGHDLSLINFNDFFIQSPDGNTYIEVTNNGVNFFVNLGGDFFIGTGGTAFNTYGNLKIQNLPEDTTPTRVITIDASTDDVSYTDISSLSSNYYETGITIDGGGSPITTGFKGFFRIPANSTILGWTILEVSDTPISGDIVVDVWKDTYANYPPTVADTIAGSEKPTLSLAIKNEDLSLGTWSTSLLKGDIIAYNVDSASTVEKVSIFIHLVKV